MAVAFWLSLASRDPDRFPESGGTLPIFVVDHGYHSGFMLPLGHLWRIATVIEGDDPAAAQRLRWLAGRYPDALWLEIGWGDAAFYQATPTVGEIDPWLAMRALFVPTSAVLQIVPGRTPLSEAFPRSDKVRLDLNLAGLEGLARRLAATIPEPPAAAIGQSLYGYGNFYPARLDYHLFRTCNHWVAWLLRGAGVPASWAPGTFSITLITELRWRAVD